MMDFLYELVGSALFGLPFNLWEARYNKQKPLSQAQKNRRQRVRDAVGLVVLGIWFGGMLFVCVKFLTP